MKKTLLLILIFFSAFGFSQSNEWMTSLDIAKRLALVQNKMIFAIWEDAASYEYHVLINDKNGKTVIVNLFDSESLNDIIWEYYVPVKLSESIYLDLFNEIKGKRSESYIQKFNDDSIKIMDINGNIINTNLIDNNKMMNFSSYIAKYAMDTSFLKQELISYSTDKNFTSSYFLVSKYIDYACFSDSNIRSEIIELSNIYLDEANNYMQSSNSSNKIISLQAIQLLRIKQNLVLNKPKKVIRQLKKMRDSEIYRVNQSLFNFLNYTAYELLKDEEKANLWKNKVSLVDLKKANLIININS